jgi:hypothetical protein
MFPCWLTPRQFCLLDQTCEQENMFLSAFWSARRSSCYCWLENGAVVQFAHHQMHLTVTPYPCHLVAHGSAILLV